VSEREPLEQAYNLAEGYLATGQYEAASRVVATLLNYDAAPNYHHLRLLLEEIVDSAPVASAQVSLAMILLSGESGEVEPERAFGLLQGVVDGDLAEPGSEAVVGLAHELIADCYIAGHGVMADPGAAFHHFLQAAERGQSKAAYNVGVAHHEGLLDQPVDLEQAQQYFELAAEGGEARAFTRLALLQLEDPEAADAERAAELLERAKELGDPDAEQLLDRLGTGPDEDD